MSNKHRTGQNDLDQRNKPRQPASAPPQAEVELPPGPEQTIFSLFSSDQADVQAQAARLTDPRFPEVQRQMMARQIGRRQGNKHLLQVMRRLEQNGRAGSSPTQAGRPQKGSAAKKVEPADPAQSETETELASAGPPAFTGGASSPADIDQAGTVDHPEGDTGAPNNAGERDAGQEGDGDIGLPETDYQRENGRDAADPEMMTGQDAAQAGGETPQPAAPPGEVSAASPSEPVVASRSASAVGAAPSESPSPTEPAALEAEPAPEIEAPAPEAASLPQETPPPPDALAAETAIDQAQAAIQAEEFPFEAGGDQVDTPLTDLTAQTPTLAEAETASAGEQKLTGPVEIEPAAAESDQTASQPVEASQVGIKPSEFPAGEASLQPAASSPQPGAQIEEKPLEVSKANLSPPETEAMSAEGSAPLSPAETEVSPQPPAPEIETLPQPFAPETAENVDLLQSEGSLPLPGDAAVSGQETPSKIAEEPAVSFHPEATPARTGLAEETVQRRPHGQNLDLSEGAVIQRSAGAVTQRGLLDGLQEKIGAILGKVKNLAGSKGAEIESKAGDEGRAVQNQAENDAAQVEGRGQEDGRAVQDQAENEAGSVETQAENDAAAVQGQAGSDATTVQGQAGSDAAAVQGQAAGAGADLTGQANTGRAALESQAQTGTAEIEGGWANLQGQAAGGLAGVAAQAGAGWTPVQAEANAAVAGLQSGSENLESETEAALPEIQQKAQDQLRSLRDEAIGIVSNAAPGSSAELNKLSGPLGAIKSRALEVLGGLQTLFAPLLNKLQTGWEGLKNLVGAKWEGLKSMAGGALETVKSLGTSAWQTVQSGWSHLKGGAASVLNNVGGHISSGLSTLGGKVNSAWSGLKEKGGSLLSGLKGMGTSLRDGLSSTAAGLVSGLKSKATGVVEGVKEKAGGAMNGLKSMAGGVWSQLTGKAGSAEGAVGNKKESALSTMQGMASGFLGKIATLLDGFRQRARGAEGALKRTNAAAKSDLKQRNTGAVSALKDEAVAAQDALRRRAGAAETQLDAGAGTALSDLETQAGAATEGLASRSQTSLSTLKGMGGRVLNGFQSIGDRVKGGVRKAWNGVQGAAGAAWNGFQTQVGGISKGIQTGWTGLKDLAGNAWQGVQQGWTGLKEKVKSGWEAVKSSWVGVVGRAIGLWGRATSAGDEEWDAVTAEAEGLRDEALQLKARPGSPAETGNPLAVRRRLGEGQTMDSATRGRMESVFGRSFSDVRIHTDSAAIQTSRGLQARAFTVGSDVVFDAGEYKPGDPLGDALLAHELAHVVQQEGAVAGPMTKAEDEDSAIEMDADRSAIGAVVSLWTDRRVTLGNIAQEAMPRLRSGLGLRRCSNKQEKSLEELLRSLENQCIDPDVIMEAIAAASPEERWAVFTNWELMRLLKNNMGGRSDEAISGLLEGQNLESVIRFMIGNQCPADPSPLLLAIQGASLQERQDVLNNPELLNLFYLGLGSLASTYVAALLEGSLFWPHGSGPDPTNNYRIQADSDFANWILGGEEDKNRPDINGGSMNCWEGIFYAAYLAGRVSYADLVSWHNEAATAGSGASNQADNNPQLVQDVDDIINREINNLIAQGYNQQTAQQIVVDYFTQELGSNYREQIRQSLVQQQGINAYYNVLENKLNMHNATAWSRGDTIPAGNIVFFDGLAHVAISLGTQNEDGETEVMSLWSTPGNIHQFQHTTVEDILDAAAGGGLGNLPVTHAPSPW